MNATAGGGMSFRRGPYRLSWRKVLAGRGWGPRLFLLRWSTPCGGFGLSRRAIGQILIDIARTVDPLVWAEPKGYWIDAVAISSDRLASTGKTRPNALSRRGI
jgi:hypothetical protein